LARQAYASAERIFVTTSECLRLIPPKWRFKVAVHLAVAMHRRTAVKDTWRPPDGPRFVFAGQLIHFKGIHLAIRALAEAHKTIPDATLTIYGDGPNRNWLLAIARQCGVAHAVKFAGGIPRQQLIDMLHHYTALVFPSFHDSGGMIVMEALSEGLPVICLDLGGPGVIINKYCGIVVPTADTDEDQVVTGIANSMISLGTMSTSAMKQLSGGAHARASELSWTSLTAFITASRK
jgi:glycosyltransferase involved in cell wall biosynthesis